MAFDNPIRTLRAFFQMLAHYFRIWFMPYHFDGDEAEEADGDEEEDHAPDRSPKPSPPPEEAAPAEAVSSESGAVAAGTGERPRLNQVLARRGATTPTALAAILGEPLDKIASELQTLVQTQLVEDLGDGRYLLPSGERRLILRANPQLSEWLSALSHPDFENDALDMIDRLCRELPLKLTVSKTLVFHLRQQKWMVWQSRESSCRVRLFGTLEKAGWTDLRHLDAGGKRFRRLEPHRWDSRDWVLFRWRAGGDNMMLETILVDAGREFQKHMRRRRGRGHAPAGEGAAETPADQTAELPADQTAELPTDETIEAPTDQTAETPAGPPTEDSPEGYPED